MEIFLGVLLGLFIVACIIVVIMAIAWHKEIHFILKGLKYGLTFSQAKRFCEQVESWDESIEEIHNRIKSSKHDVVILSFEQFLKFYNIAPQKYYIDVDTFYSGTIHTIDIYYEKKTDYSWLNSYSYTNAIALATKEDYYKLLCWCIQEADKAEEEKRRKSDILCDQNLEKYLESVKSDIADAFGEVDKRLQEEKKKLKEMSKHDL